LKLCVARCGSEDQILRELWLEILSRFDFSHYGIDRQRIRALALGAGNLPGGVATEMFWVAVAIDAVLALTGPAVARYIRITPHTLEDVSADVLELVTGLRARQIGCGGSGHRYVLLAKV
jgi:hypothetical protein